MSLFTVKTVKTKVITTLDGVTHETPEAAETHWLSKALGEVIGTGTPADLNEEKLKVVAANLIAAKAVIGPLLKVPTVRKRKTPEEKAASLAAKQAKGKPAIKGKKGVTTV